MDFPDYIGPLDLIGSSVIPVKHYFDCMGGVLDLCEMLSVSVK